MANQALIPFFILVIGGVFVLAYMISVTRSLKLSSQQAVKHTALLEQIERNTRPAVVPGGKPTAAVSQNYMREQKSGSTFLGVIAILAFIGLAVALKVFS